MSVHQLFHGLREYLNPLLKETQFLETGRLTPEEVIIFLIYSNLANFILLVCKSWRLLSLQMSHLDLVIIPYSIPLNKLTPLIGKAVTRTKEGTIYLQINNS
jgi:hypothetical protein